MVDPYAYNYTVTKKSISTSSNRWKHRRQTDYLTTDEGRRKTI